MTAPCIPVPGGAALLRLACLSGLFLMLMGAGGCAVHPNRVRANTFLHTAPAKAGSLADVDIQLFEYAAALPDEPKPSDAQPGPAAVTTAERHFISFHLKNTLQQSGYWGAVRVVPARTYGSAFRVEGRILESHGKRIRLEVRVTDAAEHSCFTRNYVFETDAETYASEFIFGKIDVFQPLYNAIANDMLTCLQQRNAGERAALDRVAAMRYGAHLVPDLYADYLETDDQDHVILKRIPAASDPSWKRLQAIQDRENKLLDAINRHYAEFYGKMWGPYLAWRSLTREQVEELERLHGRQWWAPFGGLVGGLIAGGGVFIATAGDMDSSTNEGPMDRAARRAYEVGDKLPFNYDVEIKFLSSELANAGVALASDMEPFQVLLEASADELTGSAAEQFAQWRELLKAMDLLDKSAVADPGSDGG